MKNVIEMPHNDHLPLIEASRYFRTLLFFLNFIQRDFLLSVLYTPLPLSEKGSFLMHNTVAKLQIVQ